MAFSKRILFHIKYLRKIFIFVRTYTDISVIMVRKGNTKLTVSVDARTLKEFKEFCEEEGLRLGKQIEKFMKGVLMNR